jgi:hypothetical protein
MPSSASRRTCQFSCCRRISNFGNLALMFLPQNFRIAGSQATHIVGRWPRRRFSFLALPLLLFALTAYAKHGDTKNTSQPICGVTSKFQLLNSVVRSGEPIKIRVTLHNESTSPVAFRYVTGSFIEHVRIYDARDRQVPVRLNAPFLESGADKVSLRPGEQFVNVVTADLWQIYDLEPGTYELRFYYDLRLIADETLAAKSMKRYHSKDWILWDVKTYPLTVLEQVVSDAIRNSVEQGVKASQSESVRVYSSDSNSRNPERQTVALLSSVTKPHLGSNIDGFRSAWGSPIREETLVRTARVVWRWSDGTNAPLPRSIFEAEVSFLDGIACEMVLRSKEQMKKSDLVNLGKALVPSLQMSDLARLKFRSDGSRTYALRDGGYITAWLGEKPAVMVIRNSLFLQNRELFDQEAAKVRPPTSNH